MELLKLPAAGQTNGKQIEKKLQMYGIVELQNPTGPIFARLTSMLAIKSSGGIKPNAIQHITIFGFISFMYTAIFESSALYTMQNKKSQNR